MKQHKLIFRYLDGEITREEDNLLREMINQDAELKNDFQSFVEIDYEIQKANDDIEYPENFFNSVENSIVSRMQEDIYLSDKKKNRKLVFFQYSIAASILIFFALLLNIDHFGNQSIKLNKVYTANQNSYMINNQTTNNEQSKINTISVHNQIQSIASVKKANTNSDLKKDIDETEKNNIDFANLIQSKNISSNEPNSSISEQNPEILVVQPSNIKKSPEQGLNLNKEYDEKLFSNNSPGNFNNSNMGKEEKKDNDNAQKMSLTTDYNNYTNLFSNSKYSPSFNTNFSKVHLSVLELNSFLGNDFVCLGVDKSTQVINSFTQSVGTSIDDDSRIGLETGYMNFSISQNKYVTINKGSLSSSTIQIENADDNGSVLIRTSGSSLAEQNLFWAGIFYERNFLNYNDFTLSSRLSIGASDIGFVSSLKFISKYSISKAIDILIGADAKMFTGGATFSPANSNFSSTISLIYGMRISL
jgi:hypothetical protein